MILVKIKGLMGTQASETLKKKLEGFFDGEKVLIINAENVELEFLNFDKKRCSYCGVLNNGSNTACVACGGGL